MSADIALMLGGLVASGLFAGFIGGLFGVGGGIVLVPALFVLFGAVHVGDAVRMHVAIATSLSTIVTTSWRSLAAHTKAGAVNVEILRSWSPWIALGAIAGEIGRAHV